MGFALRHPVGLTTNTWAPVAGTSFEVGRSNQERIDPVLGVQVPDQFVYSYRLAPAVWKYVRSLRGLSVVDMTALEAFFDTIDRDPFDFTDGGCGPITGWESVLLLPESYRRPYEYSGGQHQAVVLAMVAKIS